MLSKEPVDAFYLSQLRDHIALGANIVQIALHIPCPQIDVLLSLCRGIAIPELARHEQFIEIFRSSFWNLAARTDLDAIAWKYLGDSTKCSTFFSDSSYISLLHHKEYCTRGCEVSCPVSACGRRA